MRRVAIRSLKLLKSRGVHLQFVLDEGLLITDGVLAGLDQTGGADVGIAEKVHR